MFKIFNRDLPRDPICGQIANEHFISRYGKKFCSEKCIAIYKEKYRIVDPGEKKDNEDDDCYCCD